MKHSSLDSVLEAQLRAVVYLFLLDSPVDADYLGALDTLTINAGSFRIGPDNLNGPHRLAPAELQTRTGQMSQALKQLALRGLVAYVAKPDVGFRLTSDGETVANEMRTGYANQLFASALDVLEHIGDASTTELTSLIISIDRPEGVA
ncbi:hypothetical protein J2S49_000162 [Arcanobacterium wilhelmae]|uniref:MarR family transcriptional regulator n=1 Tax=Arcanobacterium wilhelmae TaxID=1803177 RepID=A0ABT9N9K3_9ACTO|nr:ABC-three component system middle component 2 [Arcanobacterium wilhelmae]MDP9800086.1 hypothetical protein [Arcanobacterium wilhelmae]